MENYIASFLLLIIAWGFGLTYYLQIRSLQPEDKRVVEFLLLLFAAVLLYRTIHTITNYYKKFAVNKKTERVLKKEPDSLKPVIEKLRNTLFKKESIFILITLFYIALLEIMGFFFCSFFYILGANILLGTKGIWKLIFISVGFIFFTYVLFVGIFEIRLPAGVLFY